MCCVSSRQNTQYQTWDQAGQEEISFCRANKVVTVAVSLFSGISVGGIAWGLYDIYNACCPYDAKLLREGVVLLSTFAVTGAACTLTWTWMCTHNVQQPAPQASTPQIV